MRKVFVLFILSFVDSTIYVYNTIDSPSVEFYDCIFHKSLPFCRRPIEPIVLNRSNDLGYCHNNGVPYLLADLRRMNISVGTVLHQWRSSIEKVEDYIRYLTNPIEQMNGHICKCVNSQSFGVTCEYLLPIGRTLTDTFYAENNLRMANSHYVQLYGDIICYETLQCNFGLLCLDWRDICDGVQQCMFGFDEENCHHLESKECEEDEYRCTNGMCIPDTYFLDGDFDCLDWSDEMQFYDDIRCSSDGVYTPCDDRICPPTQYSCGDGQCIIDRFDFQTMTRFKSECRSKREQAFICETHYINDMWTLPNGRCYEKYDYNGTKMSNLTIEDQCRFILLCDLSGAVHVDCPCGEENTFCTEELHSACHSNSIQFSKKGIMAPYVFFFYPKYYKLRPDFLLVNGTIKCHGISTDIIAMNLSFLTKLHEIEHFVCQQALNTSSTVNQHTTNTSCSRYHFRCSLDEPTCLSITALGNSHSDCRNAFDEYWLGTSQKLSDMSCNFKKKDQCYLLRQYIEQSWLSNRSTDASGETYIPFRYYCNTFWNLPSKHDENTTECKQWWKCSDDQWQCRSGQCIDRKWVSDYQWDCEDASDEPNSFNQSVPFSTICNKTTEFACFTHQKTISCITWQQIGNRIIDCYGGIDERNTILHCNQQTMLGYNYKCSSNEQCIPYWNHCVGERCHNQSDDDLWCNYRINVSFCNRVYDAVCFNGSCVRSGRCDQKFDCSMGEDEYMCEYQHISQLTRFQYREEKEIIVKNSHQKIQLIQFPIDSNITLSLPSTNPSVKSSIVSLDPTDPVAYWCNRGIGVYLYNKSIVCFCPPQYHGDKCQYHSDRISLLFHLDLSESTYSTTKNIDIVFKIVILFMFENEVLTNYFFHARAVSELATYTKKFAHYVYSRSKRFLRHKLERYLNYSNDHLYSIQIEMYEKVDFDRPKLFAVWKYPIDFDYLPVLRLAKILRFVKQDDPCASNPCNTNQDCQAILNEKSQYICLCKANFTGKNCSLKDERCANGYCSYGSLCKPGYRGLIHGNHLPYCICSFNRYGEQCSIEHDRCQSNPCRNNGSCFSTSKPEASSCICTDGYHGDKCEFRKPEIKLFINETVKYLAAVVQYFDIDFVSLSLHLVHQKVHRVLPNFIEYRHQYGTIPEIVVVKLYSNESSPNIYVISVQIDIQSIHGITQLNTRTQCMSIRQKQISPIKYHFLCENSTNLFCFYDEHYLCICNENHTRVQCFQYDFHLDRCSSCLSNGICLKGEQFLCLCPKCYSGRKCQFNSNSFIFTLDQLFYTDLNSANQKFTFRFLIVISVFLFLLGIPNNLFSLVTFRRQNSLRHGIGQYLFYMSITNQVNLTFLAARLLHLSINMTGSYSSIELNDYLCKIFNYFLVTSSRFVYWLSSLIAIERVYTTLFLRRQWLRKPHIARRVMFITAIGILGTNIHELIFVKSLVEITNTNDAMCVMEFPNRHRRIWNFYHSFVSIINSILPLMINFCSTIMISFIVARNKINARKILTKSHQSILIKFQIRSHFILQILNENKELVIGPGITLVPQLFSLPLFIISFTLYCQNLESNLIRYVLIVSYFVSFLPQLTSFMLYILPSSFYSREWYATTIGRMISDYLGLKPSTATDRNPCDESKNTDAVQRHPI
ncbi:unnamed protein product [Adineta ricciae]|uniref:Uncharacterized protein n=1 Tax=Adineta ricciae TaxID=249248 RepID=A0A814UDN0_ADIRI|nr:unnamed protein product [Adineta ricciae]CAF1174372.1 unnamed protein product [Adineta ricciae]